MARRLKFAEIFVVGIAIAGFAAHAVAVLFVALALFGVISALFGPIKYGILPDHLARAELPTGNALIEAATFAAIMGGAILASYVARDGGNPAIFGVLIMTFALLCWGASRMIPPTGEGAPDLVVQWNIARSTADMLKHIWADSRLWWAGMVTSWFWVVGAVVLSLLLPLVKTGFNGTEDVGTLFLAIFTVAIAAGSGLAAWLAAGRIILLPTAVGAVLLGLFALDLGWAMHTLVPAASPIGVGAVLANPQGLRIAIDLAGLAISGGLFIVPSFAALQAWAGPDHRARVVAACNVLNAGFMAAGTVVVGLLQNEALFGAYAPSLSTLFLGIGAASLVAAIVVARTMPSNAVRDLLSIIFRAFYRLEVKGLENIEKAGTPVIIALNHVSFLDAALAATLMHKPPVFAIDRSIAQRWWVKPFLRFANAVPLDPLKPMMIRSLVKMVEAGHPLVIFPEGRITVTGSLMKVYDGAGLIADKSQAAVVPIRIAGLERTPFSLLSREQAPRRWFPKVTATVLEPVKLAIDPALKGKARRRAAGSELYGIMSDLVFRTTATDRTVVEAIIARRQNPRRRPHRGGRSGERRAQLQESAARRRGAWPQAHAVRGARQGDRRDAAQQQRGRGDRGRADVGRAGAGDDQFYRRRRQYPDGLPGRRSPHDRHLAHLRRERPARTADRPARRRGRHRLSGGRAQNRWPRRQAARLACRRQAAGQARSRRSGRDPVHLRIGGRA